MTFRNLHEYFVVVLKIVSPAGEAFCSERCSR